MEERINPAWDKEEVKIWATKYFGPDIAQKLYAQDATGAYLFEKDRIGFVTLPYEFSDQVADKLMSHILRSRPTKHTAQHVIDYLASVQLTPEDREIVHSWWISQKVDRRIIKHSDPRFDFRIPVGVPDPIGWTSMPEPPFFNRQPTLLTLLNDCYANFRLQGEVTKPMAAFVATSPGYGKTRLLLEWAIRVFHDTRVLQAFWNNTAVPSKHPAPPFNTLIDEIEQYSRSLVADPNDGRFNRALFISRLHQTLKKSSVISASADILGAIVISNPNDIVQVACVVDVICRKIVGHALCSRFRGKVIEYANKSVMLPSAFAPSSNTDKEWLTSNGLLLPEGVLFSLFSLFMDAVDLEYKSFEYFGVPRTSPRIVLVNIDEAQSLVTLPMEEKTLAYYVLQRFYSLPTLFVKYPVRIHMLMVGLLGSEHDKLEAKATLYTRIALPLDPLSQSHCTALCRHITQQPLDENAQNIVRTLWKRSLGIPRVVQILHHVLARNKAKLVSGDPMAKKEILEQFTESAKQYFSPKGAKESAMTAYKLTQAKWEKLIVEASLCVQKKQHDVIGNTTYSTLESEGTILPFKFSTNTSNDALRNYTMPFHFYGDFLVGQVDMLKSEPEFNDDLLGPYFPSIGNVVGPDGSQTDWQGRTLVQACAVSLWARYKLNQQPGWCKLSDLIDTWPSQNHYCKFDSISKARLPITASLFKERLELLKEARSIVINRDNSAFADVLIPILKLDSEDLLDRHNELLQEVGTGEKELQQFEQANTYFLLVQCRSVATSEIVQEWKEYQQDLMGQGHVCVLLAPNLSPNEQMQYTDKWIEINGRGWLSDLFLFTLRDSDSVDEDLDLSEDSQNYYPTTAEVMSSSSMSGQLRKRKLTEQGGNTPKKPRVTIISQPEK